MMDLADVKVYSAIASWRAFNTRKTFDKSGIRPQLLAFIRCPESYQHTSISGYVFG